MLHAFSAASSVALLHVLAMLPFDYAASAVFLSERSAVYLLAVK